MMCFVIKNLKTLVGRRGSDLEQAHREQKGKKDTQYFVGKQVQHNTASILHPFRHFLHSSPTFHSLTISSQHWASQLLTQQLPCPFPFRAHQSSLPSQGLCCLPASLPWLAWHSANQGHHISLHLTDRFLNHQGKSQVRKGAALLPHHPTNPSNLKITTISI